MNSLTAHNFEKVNLLEAYSTVNKFDIICLSEFFLDSSILTENNNLKINGHKMVRADHPTNTKSGGVCVFVCVCMCVCVCVLGNLCQIVILVIQQCLTCEVTISNKKRAMLLHYI